MKPKLMKTCLSIVMQQNTDFKRHGQWNYFELNAQEIQLCTMIEHASSRGHWQIMKLLISKVVNETVIHYSYFYFINTILNSVSLICQKLYFLDDRILLSIRHTYAWSRI